MVHGMHTIHGRWQNNRSQSNRTISVGVRIALKKGFSANIGIEEARQKEGSMKEYLTIKEFAELSGVEQSTLRYWDDIGLFFPVHRDPDNNYRYYTPAQLIPLNFVTVLSDLDVPLKTIKELKDERSPDSFIRLIDAQEREINERMRKLREQYAIIHARRELISYGMRMQGTHIAVMHRADKNVNLGPLNEYAEDETFIDAIVHLVQQAKDLHVNLSFPIGGYYESLDAFIDAPKRPERFFSIDSTGNRLRPAGDYLVGITHGSYGEFGDLPQRMADYAEKNGIGVSGSLHIMYLLDEICVKDPKDYLVQCAVAIAKPEL